MKLFDELWELWLGLPQHPATFFILLLILISSVVGFYYHPWYKACVLHPYSVWRGKRRWTLLTMGLVHNSWQHLIFNVAFLLVMSVGIEKEFQDYYGNKSLLVYSLLYFVTIFFGALGTTLMNRNNFLFSTTGLSSAYFGTITYFCLLNRNEVIYDFFGVAVIYGWQCALVLSIVLVFASKIRPNDDVDHWGHFFGSLVALFVWLGFGLW
ncbi:rhomboid family intramembrane serine protease [Olivibacter sitiensis]|uniref:rhomboid family intramembrane serine protease n=1 Tax=Olivibacter sitiensis TaxID=376470 RepID=UPI000401ECB0|nr:rhomboid family intramembrane serine protease [Olivibacter sitiensis]